MIRQQNMLRLNTVVIRISLMLVLSACASMEITSGDLARIEQTCLFLEEENDEAAQSRCNQALYAELLEQRRMQAAMIDEALVRHAPTIDRVGQEFLDKLFGERPVPTEEY